MALRKKIFFSFIAMIMIGVSQMFSGLVGISRFSALSSDISRSQTIVQKVNAAADGIGQLQRLQVLFLRDQMLDQPTGVPLSNHKATIAKVTTYVEELQRLGASLQETNREDITLTKGADRLAALVDSYNKQFVLLVAAVGGKDAADSFSSLRLVIDQNVNGLQRMMENDTDERLMLKVLSLYIQVKVMNADDLNGSANVMTTKQLVDGLEKLQQAIADGKRDKQQELQASVASLKTQIDSFLTKLREIGQETTGIMGQLNKSMDDARDQLDDLDAWSKERVRGNTDALNRQVGSQNVTTIVVGIVCMAIGVLLAAVLTREIIKPIEQLRSAAERVSRGDPNVVLPEPTTNDEIAELSRSFQRMLNSLRALMSQDDEDQ